MDMEQAVDICRHWQRPRAWYNVIEIRKRQLDICFDTVGNSVERTVAKLEQCSEWLKHRTDLLGDLKDWVRQNRPDLIAELPVFDWRATEREHVQEYCKAMQRVEAGILYDPLNVADEPESSAETAAGNNASSSNSKKKWTGRRNMNVDLANENLLRLLRKDAPTYAAMGERELAKAIGCSRPTLRKCPAYLNIEVVREELKRR